MSRDRQFKVCVGQPGADERTLGIYPTLARAKQRAVRAAGEEPHAPIRVWEGTWRERLACFSYTCVASFGSARGAPTR